MKEAIEFIKYIAKPLPMDKMLLLYRSNNVVFERLELYYDFIEGLFDKLSSTYLGDDVMTKDGDRKNHFDWCFNSVLEDFEKEGIEFRKDTELYNYLLSFCMDEFYYSDDKTDPEGFEVIRKKLDYRKIKTRSEIDSLVDLYNLFEKALV